METPNPTDEFARVLVYYLSSITRAHGVPWTRQNTRDIRDAVRAFAAALTPSEAIPTYAELHKDVPRRSRVTWPLTDEDRAYWRERGVEPRNAKTERGAR